MKGSFLHFKIMSNCRLRSHFTNSEVRWTEISCISSSRKRIEAKLFVSNGITPHSWPIVVHARGVTNIQENRQLVIRAAAMKLKQHFDAADVDMLVRSL
jgi:hypothetical protein